MKDSAKRFRTDLPVKPPLPGRLEQVLRPDQLLLVKRWERDAGGASQFHEIVVAYYKAERLVGRRRLLAERMPFLREMAVIMDGDPSITVNSAAEQVGESIGGLRPQPASLAKWLRIEFPPLRSKLAKEARETRTARDHARTLLGGGLQPLFTLDLLASTPASEAIRMAEASSPAIAGGLFPSHPDFKAQAALVEEQMRSVKAMREAIERERRRFAAVATPRGQAGTVGTKRSALRRVCTGFSPNFERRRQRRSEETRSPNLLLILTLPDHLPAVFNSAREHPMEISKRSAPAGDAAAMHRPASAARAYGTSRTRIYAALKSGDLEAVKLGRATLIPDASLRAWIANLPRYTAA